MSADLLPIDPDEYAQAALGPQVALVTRMDTKTTLESAVFIQSLKLRDLHQLRMEIREARSVATRQPVSDGETDVNYPFLCAACGQPVYLKAIANRSHHFAHYEKWIAELVNCPFQDERSPPQDILDRIRYHGQREGARHRKVKSYIEQTLRTDERFADLEVEQVWRCFNEGYRRPDIAATWRRSGADLRIVFEAQVSNTYPNVVADRTDFYRRAGAQLIWIFDVAPAEDWRTLHADSFFANGQHLFVVDD